MHHESPELLQVRGLEERAFNAWPALQTVLVDGWVLRFAQGYTKRANSVNAWQPSVDAGHVAITAAPIYAAQALPLVFRLSPLAGTGADADLAVRGFTRADETIVMTLPLDPDVRNGGGGMGPDDATKAKAAVDPNMTIAARPTAAWLTGFADANHVPEQHRAALAAMIASLKLPAAFVTAIVDGAPAGYGMAVAERGMVGLFDIVTLAAARRQGVGRRLVDVLTAWGRTHGATHAYLQVVAVNAPALSLYRTIGFAEAYRYHYRIAPGTKTAST